MGKRASQTIKKTTQQWAIALRDTLFAMHDLSSNCHSNCIFKFNVITATSIYLSLILYCIQFSIYFLFILVCSLLYSWQFIIVLFCLVVILFQMANYIHHHSFWRSSTPICYDINHIIWISTNVSCIKAYTKRFECIQMYLKSIVNELINNIAYSVMKKHDIIYVLKSQKRL